MAQDKTKTDKLRPLLLVAVGVFAVLATVAILAVVASMSVSALLGSVPFLTQTPPVEQVVEVLEPGSDVDPSNPQIDKPLTPTDIGADGDTVLNGCMNDVFDLYGKGGELNCTAEDIKYTPVSVVVIDGCDYPGDTAIIQVSGEVVLAGSGGTRYDIGIYTALDGGNALTGSCAVSSIRYWPDPPYLDLDGTTDTGDYCSNNPTQPCNEDSDCLPGGTCASVGPGIQDTCGDIDDDHSPLSYSLGTLRVQCIDPDGDGLLNLPVATSWRQPGGNDLCVTPLAAFPANKSKCNSVLLTLDVPVPKAIEVVKELEPGIDSGLFNLLIDGTSYANDVGDGGSTGQQSVDAGPHTVSETGGSGTDLTGYATAISCQDQVGRCSHDETIHCTNDAYCDTVKPGSTCTLPGPVVAECQNCTSIPVEVPTAQTYIVCTITNERSAGSLEVVKDVVPDDPGTNWDIAVAGPTPFGATLSGDDTTGAQPVNSGSYTIVETAGTGTSLADYDTSWACTIDGAAGPSGAGASINVQVGADQTVVCTFTNERKTGQLEVVKDLDPDDDPGLFNLQIDGVTQYADASDGDTSGKKTVKTGTHTVGETAGSGTDLGDYANAIECLDAQGAVVANGAGAGPLNVEVGWGDDIVCTITNVRKTGQLEVVKDLVPDNDPGLFNLQIDGNDQATDVGDGGATGKKTVNTGAHTVGETAGTGTTLDDYSYVVSCIDNAHGDASVTAIPGAGASWTVDVGWGDDIVCTIINVRKTGLLEVVKDLDPDDDLGLFNLQIDGITEYADASDGDGTGTKTVNTGTHTVGETAGSGTDLGVYDISIACLDAQGAVVAEGSHGGPLDVDVGWNDDIVCTITNERKMGSLDVAKLVDDDSLWTLGYSGPASGSADVGNGGHLVGDPVPTGTYDVWEVPAAGTDGSKYNSTGSCTGATNNGELSEDRRTITGVVIGQGDRVVCTFVNSRKAGSVTIVKETNPPGLADVFDFASNTTPATFSLGDGQSQQFPELPPGAVYNFDEIVPPEWDLTDIVCTGQVDSAVAYGDSGVSIVLAPDEHIVCTFTNDPWPVINVVKTADPEAILEPGGWVTYTVAVTNNGAAVEPLALTRLDDDVYGNLTDGTNPDISDSTCALVTIQPGDTYSCTFLAEVLGEPGDVVTDTVTAAGTDDEDNEVEASDDASVTIVAKPPNGGVGLAVHVVVAGLAVLGLALLVAGVLVRWRMPRAG